MLSFSSHLPKAEELVSEKETEAEPKVSTETENPLKILLRKKKKDRSGSRRKYDDMPEENAELPVI